MSLLHQFLPGVQHMQNLHPLAVHFPLAFFPAAALVYILAWITGRESWAWTGLWLLGLGTASAVAAVSLGLYAEPGVMMARSVRANLLEHHKALMLTTLGLALSATIWAGLKHPFPTRGRPLFILLLLILLAVMTLGADYGGRMVYDYNAGGNACSQPIEFTE